MCIRDSRKRALFQANRLISADLYFFGWLARKSRFRRDFSRFCGTVLQGSLPGGRFMPPGGDASSVKRHRKNGMEDAAD